MPDALLLDALGTLVELEPPWPLLQGELAARGAVVSEAQAREALLTEIAFYRAHHDEAGDAAALEDLRERCTEVLRAALPAPARAVEDLRGALLGSLRFRAYAEAPAVLRELRARGVRLVVVSNWDVSLHEALERTGLAPLVDGALSSAEVRCAKPGGAIFAAALALARVGAQDAAHAGDSVEADVAGALAAGIAPVLVDRDGTAGPAPPGVPVLADLTGLLELWPYRPR